MKWTKGYLANEFSPDWSELVHTPNTSTYDYFCSSKQCIIASGQNLCDMAKVLKFKRVKLMHNSDCIDCGSVMFNRKAFNLPRLE